ncbi:hypothetical protein CONPUDRAFT_26779, partial [Coniophora puteana RWD-64-598 SS2]
LTHRESVARFAETQRLYLNLHAYLDYVSVVRPRVWSPLPAFPHAVNTHWMGAFTDSAQVCHMLYAAGVPIWYIRDPQSIPPDMNIIRHVEVIPAKITYREFFDMDTHDKPFPILR